MVVWIRSHISFMHFLLKALIICRGTPTFRQILTLKTSALVLASAKMRCCYHLYNQFGRMFIFQAMMDQKADPENPKSWPKFILRVDHHMCNYLTSGKRTRLAILSSSLKVWILLKVSLNRKYIAILIFETPLL